MMAFMWAAIAKSATLVSAYGFYPIKLFVYMGMAGVSINIMLTVLNLIPIPPLDGSRVVASLLPRNWAMEYERIEPYGFMILMLLIFTGALGGVLHPV